MTDQKPHTDEMSVEQMRAEVKELFGPTVDPKKQESPGVPLSKTKLNDVTMAAKDIIENSRIARIEMEGQTNTFAVKDLGGTLYCKSLDDKSCTCGSKTVCCHMIACSFAAGLQSDFAIPVSERKKKIRPIGRDMKNRKQKHGQKTPTCADSTHYGTHGTPSGRWQHYSTPKKPKNKCKETNNNKGT